MRFSSLWLETTTDSKTLHLLIDYPHLCACRYIFTITSYLIGVFIFATIVGQVGNVITNRNANRLEFERLLDGAKTYMRHHKVPGGMKRRVLRWYDYSWSRGRIQGGGDINTALGLLPDKLKTELALHVNLSVLKKVRKRNDVSRRRRSRAFDTSRYSFTSSSLSTLLF